MSANVRALTITGAIIAALSYIVWTSAKIWSEAKAFPAISIHVGQVAQ